MLIKKEIRGIHIFFTPIIFTVSAHAAVISDILSKKSMTFSESSVSVCDLIFDDNINYLENEESVKTSHRWSGTYPGLAKMTPKFISKLKKEINPSTKVKVVEKIYSILIAEDNLVIRKTLERHFKKDFTLPHTLTFAHDGKEAFEHLMQGKHFDWLVTDIQMPILNGIELIRKIIEVNMLNIPITVYSTEEKAGEEGIAKKIPAGIKIIKKEPKKLLAFLREQLTLKG